MSETGSQTGAQVEAEKQMEPQAMIQAYLQAYDERDLPRCMDFYADDAVVNFASGIYRGKHDIEQWHNDRFAADLRLLRIERISLQGEAVVVDATATSKVARAWKVSKFAGRATFVCRQGRISEVKFSLRTTIPLEGW